MKPPTMKENYISLVRPIIGIGLFLFFVYLTQYEAIKNGFVIIGLLFVTYWIGKTVLPQNKEDTLKELQNIPIKSSRT